MLEYKKKFTRNRYRLKNYDYNSDGVYYITINTKYNYSYFGKIMNSKMIYSKIGLIAKEEWEKTGEIRENVVLDEYVIMPDHFHAIVIINSDKLYEINRILRQSNFSFYNGCSNKFSSQNNLGNLVRVFKAMVTHRCKKLNISFAWHMRYYDSLLLTKKSINNVRSYIRKNPYNYYLIKEQ